jgi:hypothetical protein
MNQNLIIPRREGQLPRQINLEDALARLFLGLPEGMLVEIESSSPGQGIAAARFSLPVPTDTVGDTVGFFLQGDQYFTAAFSLEHGAIALQGTGKFHYYTGGESSFMASCPDIPYQVINYLKMRFPGSRILEDKNAQRFPDYFCPDIRVGPVRIEGGRDRRIITPVSPEDLANAVPSQTWRLSYCIHEMLLRGVGMEEDVEYLDNGYVAGIEFTLMDRSPYRWLITYDGTDLVFHAHDQPSYQTKLVEDNLSKNLGQTAIQTPQGLVWREVPDIKILMYRH